MSRPAHSETSMSNAAPTDAAPHDYQAYFEPFRQNIVGIDQTFPTPFGDRRIYYFDWTASGRLYAPIERRLSEQLGPFVGNTHTESSITGTLMTQAYHHAHEIGNQQWDIAAGDKRSGHLILQGV